MEIFISLTASVLGMTAIAVSAVCCKKARECRDLLEFTEKQIQDLDAEVSQTNETVGAALNRLSENTRRVAWVETKVKKPQPRREDILEEATFIAPQTAPKLGIVERRNRILALAARGQSPESIASVMGMMPGEVQLITNLNRPAMGLN